MPIPNPVVEEEERQAALRRQKEMMERMQEAQRREKCGVTGIIMCMRDCSHVMS